MKKQKVIHGFFLGVVLLGSLFFLMPLLFCVTNSFKSYNVIIADFFALPEKIDFAIYKETWELLQLGEKFANTLLYTVSTVVVCAVITPMAAYKLGRVEGRTTNLLTLLFVVPIMVPFTTICVPLCTMMGKIHLTNTKIGYILASIGLSVPFSVHVIRAFIHTVPLEIEECAQIDGAKPLRLFFTIVYPLLLPAISTVTIITAVGTWCDLVICKILASSTESLLNVQMKLYTRFSSNSSDWEHAFPAIVISCLPTIAFFLVMQKQVIAGVSAGAVKG